MSHIISSNQIIHFESLKEWQKQLLIVPEKERNNKQKTSFSDVIIKALFSLFFFFSHFKQWTLVAIFTGLDYLEIYLHRHQIAIFQQETYATFIFPKITALLASEVDIHDSLVITVILICLFKGIIQTSILKPSRIITAQIKDTIHMMIAIGTQSQS